MSRHEIENERQEYKSLLIQNPNYFGNLPQIKKKHVQKKVFDTKYEEIKCIGYKPDEDLLYAVINVKLPYGYKGGLCSDGSIEYVRFYVDWNSDGNYNDADEDAGIAALNVHDIPDQGDCLEKYKPLSYTATIKLKPKRKPCTTPYLVKVKAILSWETPPPSEEPNYPSVWGNVLESWIQIEPKELLLIDILNIKDLVKVKMDEKLVDLNAPITKKYAYTSQELKQVYQNKDVPEHRYDSAKMYQVMDSLMYDPSLKIKYQAIPDYKKIIEKVEAIQEKKYDTTYEEITCLGLDYDRDTLIATLKIKVLNGYSGGLCSDGSYEHVAFWAYIHDPSVFVGRIQNFKSWSPEMVPDPATNGYGLEYFCSEGDEIWSMSDAELIDQAMRDLSSMGWGDLALAEEGVVFRQAKAYPVYDEGYSQRVDVIHRYLSTISNLQSVGRNGMHRYNNQDHSMYTAMLAVKNLLGEDHNVWSVNTEPSYCEKS
ncbi:hypothetical protein MUP51_02095 [Candidatus Bathyarchaeota archaeon]|nr:hypothetical protein [Candidatus Bathyarchaeota archaeon]